MNHWVQVFVIMLLCLFVAVPAVATSQARNGSPSAINSGDATNFVKTGSYSNVMKKISYSNVNCAGYFGNLSASEYLNLSKSDSAKCPIRQMFRAANNYSPVWGYETNVAREYGKVLVRQSGACTVIPDTALSYDFQIPCKAHDYCYDLRKASFSGTVTDLDCDVVFYQLMDAHCKHRASGHRGFCNAVRNGAFSAVLTPPVVTDPNPGLVRFVNVASKRCLDVEGPSLALRTPLQIWSCKNVSQQKYRIWPSPGSPGYFQVKPLYPNNRCSASVNSVWIDRCVNNANAQKIAIYGVGSKDEYTIHSRAMTRNCWVVPPKYADGVDVRSSTCNALNSRYRWKIQNGQ